jgi:hypothetical protein
MRKDIKTGNFGQICSAQLDAPMQRQHGLSLLLLIHPEPWTPFHSAQ